MTDELKRRLGYCGADVEIAPDAQIEHPELFEVHDRVKIGPGFISQGGSRVVLGDDVSFFPRCFMQGEGTLTVGERVAFYPNTYFSVGGEGGVISVGADSHFAVGCALYGGGGLRIGEWCNVAAHVVMATVQHDPRLVPDTPMGKTGQSAPISIADDVWFGANASVVPGVAIASGCIIGAGAVVTRDTEPNGIYLGVPAVRKADRTA